jgi:pimeloyl-ACP methyl ester carboxylesterase
MQEWDLAPAARGDVRLRVCEWDGEVSAASPPVVVLHGFLEQGLAWDAVARQLGRRVVAPDHRGHGRSDHVGGGGWYHFWDYVGDVDHLVDHLGGRVDLVGHSMGGTVAALFAGARPGAVRRLVLVDGLGPPDTTARAVERARGFLDHRRHPPEHGVIQDLDEATGRIRAYNGVDEATARTLAARVTEPHLEGLRWTWDALHRARMPTPFDAALFIRFLAEIRAPVLAVEGGRSPFVLPDWDARAAAVADLRREVIPDAGHLLHHEVPDRLAATIRAFLSGADPGGHPTLGASP